MRELPIISGDLCISALERIGYRIARADTLSNGRVFAHTLLFAVLLLTFGVYVYISRRNSSFLCLSFGNMAHLGLDEMWLDPRTLF